MVECVFILYVINFYIDNYFVLYYVMRGLFFFLYSNKIGDLYEGWWNGVLNYGKDIFIVEILVFKINRERERKEEWEGRLEVYLRYYKGVEKLGIVKLVKYKRESLFL